MSEYEAVSTTVPASRPFAPEADGQSIEELAANEELPFDIPRD
jgi:hypothetical protein